MTEYTLVGSDYVPVIKRRKSDKVYWKDVLPHERITEEDINNNIRWEVQHKYRRWYGCGRAQLMNDTLYGNSWGYHYQKYLPCRVKTYKETGFCKAHLKGAIKDGYATEDVLFKSALKDMKPE